MNNDMGNRLDRAMRINREREQRYRTAANVINKIHFKWFEYAAHSNKKLEQARRVRDAMRERLDPLREQWRKEKLNYRIAK